MSDLLRVENLRTSFFTSRGEVKAVDDVSFSIARGQTLGLVGESGCGKSVTSLSLMRLVPKPQGKLKGGRIIFEDRDLSALSEDEMRGVRGARMAMIFQEPMTSLNPVYTIGDQIAEGVRLHLGMNKKEAWERAGEMLELVGIPSARSRLGDYPHQLSGGMRQRVMIAMALSCNPKLLIADEPTTALDVTIQAQILELLKRLKAEFDMSILLITHDLGVIADIAVRAAVMYAGKIVEEAPVGEIFKSPLHPYTEGLLKSIPKLSDAKGGRLSTIPGSVPDLTRLPPGCSFRERCSYNMDICARREPELLEAGPGRRVSCWRRHG